MAMTNPFGRHLRQEPKKQDNPLAQVEEQLPAVPAENEIIEETTLYRDLTPEQINKLVVWTARQDLGLSVAQGPLVCREGCGHREVCPLYEDKIHPLGKRCPVEGSLMLRWKRKWAESLGMNLDKPDDNDAFDLKLLDDLAGISMLKQRAFNEMATEAPEIAEKVVAGYVNDDPMEKIILNPRVQLIERLGKLELKIYAELLSTRKAKFQVAGRVDDMSRRQAELNEKMRRVREEQREKAEEIVDADYEVKE
jgi:hypothetical protein